MIRTYCDNCGDEILDTNNVTKILAENVAVVAKNGKRYADFKAEVSVAFIAPVVNHRPDVCFHCLVDTLALHDARPKVRPMALEAYSVEQLGAHIHTRGVK